MLRRVARVLEATAATQRPGSFAARMGGEEFLLVLVDCCDGRRRWRVFEEVRATIARQPWADLTRGLPVTVSIGVAVSPHPLPLHTAELLEPGRRPAVRGQARGSRPGGRPRGHGQRGNVRLIPRAAASTPLT